MKLTFIFFTFENKIQERIQANYVLIWHTFWWIVQSVLNNQWIIYFVSGFVFFLHLVFGWLTFFGCGLRSVCKYIVKSLLISIIFFSLVPLFIFTLRVTRNFKPNILLKWKRINWLNELVLRMKRCAAV